MDSLFSLVVLFLAGLDSVFYLWSFNSISSLVQSLQVRRQSLKLALYSQLRNVLMVSVGVSAAWALYGGYLYNSGNRGAMGEGRGRV